jgi:hypothetical protein
MVKIPFINLFWQDQRGEAMKVIINDIGVTNYVSFIFGLKSQIEKSNGSIYGIEMTKGEIEATKNYVINTFRVVGTSKNQATKLFDIPIFEVKK